ncbi:MAG: hypothetical protein GY774_04870 [Planctomycetes bacterium]|nr:hypothetical protein [Planctomycetota bacterium]
MKAIELVKFVALVAGLTMLGAALAWVVYSHPLLYLFGLTVFGIVGVKEYRNDGKPQDVITITIMVCLWWPMALVGAVLIIAIKLIEDLCKYAHKRACNLMATGE